MKYSTIKLSNLSVNVCLSAFENGGAGEYHAMIEGSDVFLTAEMQYFNLENAVEYLLKSVLPPATALAFKYYFVSDAVNHGAYLQNVMNCAAACTAVQQQPLSGVKVVLWAYFIEKAEVETLGGSSAVVRRSAYSHFFDMQMYGSGAEECSQTKDIFETYAQKLNGRQCTLLNNAVRTWIYVCDVDNRYAGMVKARKKHFMDAGLNRQTHYIASTGIEGRGADSDAVVMVNAYSIAGIDIQQIGYINCKTHLNAASDYGVTFERAASIDYGDRRHILVSGTASIDSEGQIVAPFDIDRQTERTLDNISALLKEGGADFGCVSQMIVYLRDSADYHFVYEKLQNKYPDIPKVVLRAPVCRPKWLIEIECIAVVNSNNTKYAPF